MHTKLAMRLLPVIVMTGFVLAGTLDSAPAIAKGYYGSQQVTLQPGIWKIDVAHSNFGPDYSTLVIERGDAPSGATSSTGRFVTLTGGNVYLATAPEGNAKKIDYSDLKDMNLLQVGENAQWIDNCGFNCQSGFTDRRLTIRFRNVNGGMPDMSNLVVFNRK